MLALSNRQRQALHDAHNALINARRLCESSKDFEEHIEVLALELRTAMDALSLLVGEIAADELLDRIFANFCIGK